MAEYNGGYGLVIKNNPPIDRFTCFLVVKVPKNSDWMEFNGDL